MADILKLFGGGVESLVKAKVHAGKAKYPEGYSRKTCKRSEIKLGVWGLASRINAWGHALYNIRKCPSATQDINCVIIHLYAEKKELIT